MDAVNPSGAPFAGSSRNASPHEVIFEGSLREIQDHFLRQHWSDGLPIVPPTPEAVGEFLSFTDRGSHEIIAELPPQLQQASILSIAVNGVMAGCRPEYMPVLVAAVEAIADPQFRLEDAGSTPGWEPLLLVSGPLVDELALNSALGLMKVGRQANATIGRFLRMYMRNVAGLHTHDETDKGSVGYTFNVAMAEDARATRAVGWRTLAEEDGHGPEQTMAQVQSAVAISPPIYSGGASVHAHLEPIVHYLTASAGPWAYTFIKYGRSSPLLVLSPSVAQGIAASGWSRKDVQAHLYEHVRLPARLVERYALHVEGAEISLHEYVSRGIAPAEYADSDDPNRMVRLFQDPSTISVVVAGDPGRNQCRAYINNHEQGHAVRRPVQLPGDYAARLARYREVRPDPAIEGAAMPEGYTS